MRTIFKYTLEAKTIQVLDLPRDAHILSVMEQREQVVIYAIVNDDTDMSQSGNKTTFEIMILGTGHSVDLLTVAHTFLGTVKLHEGQLMFHVFFKEEK